MAAPSAHHTNNAAQLQAMYERLETHRPSALGALAGEPVVPGVGDPHAAILCIGEAPGFHESQQREPFVGRSGQLFTKILEAQGIPRKSVYITNVVKIRPPENRDPTPAEITAFRPYLDEEITTIAPKLIITLGRFSMGKFLPDVKISQVHGRLHRVLWNGRSLYVLPMYHPAAALRNPEMCRSFEQDFAKLPKILTWIDEHTQEEHWQHDVQEALLS